MRKAASLPLGLIFLFVTAAVPWAQPAPAPADTAVDEAVRRQADTILLRQKLGQAASAWDRKDIGVSAKLYEDAYTLVQRIGGSGIDAERKQTVSGLVAARMDLARAAQKGADLIEADKQVSRVLKVDPGNADALAFQRNNNKLLEEQRGRIPTDAAMERVRQVANDVINAATLVQDGKLLFEIGKLDEAEAELKKAIAIDPENKAAFNYLSLVKEARYAEAERRREQSSKKKIVDIVQDWQEPATRETLPIPNPYARTNLIHTSPSRQAIVRKLDLIHMDKVFYDGATLGDVVRSLSEEAAKRDPEKRGINFMINPNADTAGASAPAAPLLDPVTGAPLPAASPAETPDINAVQIKINPALTDLRLKEVLDAIVKVRSEERRVGKECTG
jgi:tetratricopeptide (TPR) repeat protein